MKRIFQKKIKCLIVSIKKKSGKFFFKIQKNLPKFLGKIFIKMNLIQKWL